jgi:hypothetical protein
MNMGFDESLSRALKVDRQTLFSGYATISPDVASRPGDDLRAALREKADVAGLKELRVLLAAAEALCCEVSAA